jgi:exopolysaccharide biosynthesis WecB/TagA/CpsF family protein
MLRDTPSWPRMVVGNVVIDLVNLDQTMSLVRDSISGSGPLALCSVNLHYLHVYMDRSDVIRRSSEVNVPNGALRWVSLIDGMPLVRRANALTGRSWPKLSGSDLLQGILELAATRGTRVGFLGGSVETHHQLRDVLGTQMPTLRIVGTWAPSHSDLSNAIVSERIASEIRDAQVEILVVALSKPMQEDWIANYGLACRSRLFLPFGAAIDFLAARKRRAPRWISTVGVEWVWRLLLEPRRLGRRYLIDCPPMWIRMRRKATLLEPSVDADF